LAFRIRHGAKEDVRIFFQPAPDVALEHRRARMEIVDEPLQKQVFFLILRGHPRLLDELAHQFNDRRFHQIRPPCLSAGGGKC